MRIEFLKEYEVKDGSETKYLAGQVIDVNDASANHFIVRGAARKTDKPVTSASELQTLSNSNGAEGMDDAKLEQLVEAIALLDPENPEHYTNSNKPEIAALKEVIGDDELKISAAERDKAYQVYLERDGAGDEE